MYVKDTSNIEERNSALETALIKKMPDFLVQSHSRHRNIQQRNFNKIENENKKNMMKMSFLVVLFDVAT